MSRSLSVVEWPLLWRVSDLPPCPLSHSTRSLGLSMSGFIKACIRRQRDDFRVRKSGCKRVANPRAPAGAIREAIAPYGRYSAASSPKVQSTGYLDTIQNKAAVALPMPIVRGARRPAKGLPRSAVYFNDVRVRSSIPNGAHFSTEQ